VEKKQESESKGLSTKEGEKTVKKNNVGRILGWDEQTHTRRDEGTSDSVTGAQAGGLVVNWFFVVYSDW